MRRGGARACAAMILAPMLLAACSATSTTPDPPAVSSTVAPSPEMTVADNDPSALPMEYASADGRLEVDLTADMRRVPYRDGTRWALTYNGQTTSPTLRVRPGDILSVRLINNLPEPTNLHTHGLHVSPEGDSDNVFVTVAPGEERVYRYEIPADHPSGTFWYHPHRHGLTAKQVAAGLAGAIIVEDTVDAPLDEIATDRVLIVSDPPLVDEDPWPYDGDQPTSDMGMGMGGTSGVTMHMTMMGRNGPRLLTNGQDGITITSEPGRLEHLRLVNATASSRVAFAWSDGTLTRIATEGGRLSSAVEDTIIVLSPGERTEVLVAPGAQESYLVGQRLSNDGGLTPLTEPELVALISPAASEETPAVPDTISSPQQDLFAADVQIDQVRQISLEGHMTPTINGQLFDPDVINMEARVGTVEEWVITNNGVTVHPIHLHAWPFQVKGEEGWQDVVNVQPGSQETIRVEYEDFGGRTVLHCHILDHEDGGMMLVIEVTE